MLVSEKLATSKESGADVRTEERNVSWLERYFKLKENGTDVRTELLAGLTTFLTMAYIIFVNPSILGDAGMPKDSVFVATCLAAAIGTRHVMIPLPRFLAPRIAASAEQEGDDVHVRVRISAPLAGLLVEYGGLVRTSFRVES